MKFLLLTILPILMTPELAPAQIANPVSGFKMGLTIPAGDKILKWECDLNGDGKNDVLLSL